MMGVSHATSGLCAGLLLAQAAPGLLAVHGPADAFAFALTTAGFAMLPDLDHPSAEASRRFGPASWIASAIVRPLSRVVFRATATRWDRGSGEHRFLTHTALTAVIAGVAVNAAVAWWGTPVVWGTLFVGLALAVKGVDHLVPGPPSLLAAAGLTAGVALLGGTSPWVGVAVTIGMLVHICGDAATESGAPMLWPARIGGQAWYPLGLPRPLRFRTGGPVEALLLVLMSAGAVWLAVRAVPGGHELLVRAWSAATS